MNRLLAIKKIKILRLLTLTMLLGKSCLVFPQCSVSSTLLTETFDGYTGTDNDLTAIKAYLAGKGENAGQYDGAAGNCSVKGITNSAVNLTNTTTAWKRNTPANSCESGPAADCAVCNDANNITDATSGSGKAYVLDGCGNVPNGKVWCYTTSASYGAGANFRMSAKYTSPWCGSATANDPAMYFTINGTIISASAAVVTQWSGSSSPYFLQQCYYTLPVGTTSAPVTLCINMTQESAGVYGVANSQGDDLMLDDIVIEVMTGAGCASNSGNCSYTGPTIPLPVELLSFSADKGSVYGSSIVRWVSATEKDVNYYIVEKSIDGFAFNEIGKVSAVGTSSLSHVYSLEDNNLIASCYYRLKMVDKDGSFQYSKIIFLPNEENHVWVINNVPGSEELEIKAVVKEPVRWNIKIYSVLGEEYLNQQVYLSAGENSLLKRKNGRKETCICRISDEGGALIYMGKVFW